MPETAKLIKSTNMDTRKYNANVLELVGFVKMHKRRQCKLDKCSNEFECFAWHCAPDKRKDPETCCPCLIQGCEQKAVDACFHPLLFRTKMCENAAHGCLRGDTCAHAHCDGQLIPSNFKVNGKISLQQYADWLQRKCPEIQLRRANCGEKYGPDSEAIAEHDAEHDADNVTTTFDLLSIAKAAKPRKGKKSATTTSTGTIKVKTPITVECVGLWARVSHKLAAAANKLESRALKATLELAYDSDELADEPPEPPEPYKQLSPLVVTAQGSLKEVLQLTQAEVDELERVYNSDVSVEERDDFMPPKKKKLGYGHNVDLTKFKTTLCDKWQRALCATGVGSCPYGNKCTFAHGIGDLRPKPVKLCVPVKRLSPSPPPPPSPPPLSLPPPINVLLEPVTQPNSPIWHSPRNSDAESVASGDSSLEEFVPSPMCSPKRPPTPVTLAGDDDDDTDDELPQIPWVSKQVSFKLTLRLEMAAEDVNIARMMCNDPKGGGLGVFTQMDELILGVTWFVDCIELAVHESMPLQERDALVHNLRNPMQLMFK